MAILKTWLPYVNINSESDRFKIQPKKYFYVFNFYAHNFCIFVKFNIVVLGQYANLCFPYYIRCHSIC